MIEYFSEYCKDKKLAEEFYKKKTNFISEQFGTHLKYEDKKNLNFLYKKLINKTEFALKHYKTMIRFLNR